MALKKKGGIKPSKPSPTPSRKKANVKSSAKKSSVAKKTSVAKTKKNIAKPGIKKTGVSSKGREKAKANKRISYKNEYVKLLEQNNKLLKKEVKTIQKKIEQVEEEKPYKTAAQVRDEKRAAAQRANQPLPNPEDYYVPKPKSITALEAWEILKEIKIQVRARDLMLEELLNASVNR